MPIDCFIADRAHRGLFDRVADGVFDQDLDPDLVDAFLADERHHIALACDTGSIVGFVSGVHYLHPDKPPELWINEVGVAPSHRRQGLAARLMTAMLSHARALGCVEAWVLAEEDDAVANAFYRSLAKPGDPTSEGAVMHSFDLRE